MIKRTKLTVLLMLVMFSIVGCGQKGPLYLPDPPPVNDKEPADPEN
ncbi:hypothetical protein CWE15_10920 [Aliidiomarina taiwanensis]|uniref:Lipopeptide n=1 Tax=Aliidiomarina taiwanensis TaxID=946228 RepID=A0A432WVS2_9GAMM|nr:lipoprotein [Aliidiomarina taiwanensis]RUO37866.1 hypothetical protein CWE15_10920 [Aliidiomarina taiwanensis]